MTSFLAGCSSSSGSTNGGTASDAGSTTPLDCGATATTPEQNTAAHLTAIEGDPTQLQAFLTQMPKGGDLHHQIRTTFPSSRML